MQFTTWSPSSQLPDDRPANSPPQRVTDELFVTFDRARSVRVLILPALFDEANKLRRFTLCVMRALDEAGIDCALPDWPGCHESLAPMRDQTLRGWRSCAVQAAEHFKATHTLSLRAGALLAPDTVPGWRYAPLDGVKLLSGLLRAKVIAEREAGRAESRDGLIDRGRAQGLTLGGWTLGPQLLQELETAALEQTPHPSVIEPSLLGGSSLWLRAEPGEDGDQAEALARWIAGSADNISEAPA